MNKYVSCLRSTFWGELLEFFFPFLLSNPGPVDKWRDQFIENKSCSQIDILLIVLLNIHSWNYYVPLCVHERVTPFNNFDSASLGSTFPLHPHSELPFGQHNKGKYAQSPYERAPLPNLPPVSSSLFPYSRRSKFAAAEEIKNSRGTTPSLFRPLFRFGLG